MEVYVFKKPGFKKRQSQKLKDVTNRGSILIRADIINDGKVMLIHTQKDHTLFPLFIHILSKLDLETETWEVRADEFKNWFRRTFNVNNSFKIEKRLNWLLDAGLIEFRSSSDDVQMTSRSGLDDFLKGEKIPSEQAETLTPVISNYNKQTNKQTSTPYPLPEVLEKNGGGGVLFEINLRGQGLTEDEWVFRCLLEARRSKNLSTVGCDTLKSLCSLYPSHFEQWKRWATLPMPRRMAAFVFVHLHKTPDEPFKYALKMATDGNGGEYEGILRQATAQVEAKDYKVTIE